ncbi:hypothetical protein DOTSEDRAFT_76423 [Dothistroma septosporum NZE10]|uniref:Uncharacterized protein n=1 Tax=Dothistroma septosporum (strain NZE10 / CBS 128990) TaxID=675120 RepID=N1Q2R9_DOTSN|nr:hypothetical protein DOTSEDRAFT_76423 [Dothistroma septosporum NZE10]
MSAQGYYGGGQPQYGGPQYPPQSYPLQCSKHHRRDRARTEAASVHVSRHSAVVSSARKDANAARTAANAAWTAAKRSGELENVPWLESNEVRSGQVERAFATELFEYLLAVYMLVIATVWIP